VNNCCVVSLDQLLLDETRERERERERETALLCIRYQLTVSYQCSLFCRSWGRRDLSVWLDTWSCTRLESPVPARMNCQDWRQCYPTA